MGAVVRLTRCSIGYLNRHSGSSGTWALDREIFAVEARQDQSTRLAVSPNAANNINLAVQVLLTIQLPETKPSLQLTYGFMEGLSREVHKARLNMISPMLLYIGVLLILRPLMPISSLLLSFVIRSHEQPVVRPSS